MRTPFSLRAELKGVEVALGVTLRYWEAGAGRALVMLPGLGHAASLYKYQLEGLCDDEFRQSWTRWGLQFSSSRLDMSPCRWSLPVSAVCWQLKMNSHLTPGSCRF